MIIVALVIVAVGGGGGGSPTPGPARPSPLDLAAPPHVGTQAANCAKVLERLPVTLRGLDPRVVHTTPDTPYVVAWGDPAIVLRCGVDRPADLGPGSSAVYVNAGSLAGPYFDVTRRSGANVYTTVDRAAYVSVTVPAKYPADSSLGPLAEDIAAALPAVCSTSPNEPDPAKLCTRRK